ncbi:MAG: aspartate carbamoyltransferase catalytic subunit [Abditibacteriota bacterium]|nr:aspartate carbamoyltransferase catalytic subunit [Abditibacteriota bacterium]
MRFTKKDILGLEYLTPEEITLIIETARTQKDLLSRPIKKVPILRGKSVCTLFYENSTRTRTSFELAAKMLSADTSSVSVSGSSINKGESFKDTLLTLESMGIDLFIIRHEASGSSHYASQIVKSHVVNAGDGLHAHPTQGLLDMLTIYENKGKFEGLNVCVVGDISHSRVARSNVWGLAKMGAHVRVCGPSTLIPPDFDKLPCEVYTDLDKALEGADAVNVLRIQKERMDRGFFPTIGEYVKLYGINNERLKGCKDDVIVLHPGPINRGVEIDADVAYNHSVILDQVTNGVAVRMAILYLLLGGGKAEIN